MRACRAWVISLAAAMLLLAGCGGGSHQSPAGGGGSHPLPARATDAARHLTGVAATPRRSSKLERLSCAQEITEANSSGGPIRPRPGDLVIGPLSFPGGRRLAHMRPRDFGTPRSGDKIPPVLAPGATVTIKIAPEARSGVVMDNPQAPRGVVAVVYHGCPHAWGFFPQSFRFTDHRVRGCVPMDIAIRGRRPRRVTLSLFAGRCPP